MKRLFVCTLILLLLVGIFGSCTPAPGQEADSTTANSDNTGTDDESSTEEMTAADSEAARAYTDPVLSKEITDRLTVVCAPVITLGENSSSTVDLIETDLMRIGLDPYHTTYKRDDVPATVVLPQVGEETLIYTGSIRRNYDETSESRRYLVERDIYTYHEGTVTTSVEIQHETGRVCYIRRSDNFSEQHGVNRSLCEGKWSEEQAVHMAYDALAEIVPDIAVEEIYKPYHTGINALGLYGVRLRRYICGVATDECIAIDFDSNGDWRGFSAFLLTAYDPLLDAITEEAIGEARAEILRQIEQHPTYTGKEPFLSDGLLRISTEGVVYLTITAITTGEDGYEIQHAFYCPVPGAALIFPD